MPQPAELDFIYQEWDPVVERRPATRVTEAPSGAERRTDATHDKHAHAPPVLRLGPQLRDAIQAARVQKRWTQRQVANEIGVTVDTIDRYERGLEFPLGEVLSKLQQVLCVRLVP